MESEELCMPVQARSMFGKSRSWRNPFGDGKTSGRIVEILRCELG